MIKVSNKEHFKDVCKNAKSMSEAANKLGLHRNTFDRIAKRLGCYYPNQGLRGYSKPKTKIGIGNYSLSDILDGKHPGYQSYKLKKRLIAEGLKENKCELCGISKWRGNPLSVELDHIDGNPGNNKLENLQLLCPNCHSQTPTFRARQKSLSREIH